MQKMNFLWSYVRCNPIYGLTFAILLILSACNNKPEFLLPITKTGDSELIKEQLKLLSLRTKAENDATNTILITTAPQISLTVEHSGDIVVNWGDGMSDINTFTHTYTDNLPVHTILFYGRQNAITSLTMLNQEIIYVDISRDTALIKFGSWVNRYTQLDVSRNIRLTDLVSWKGHLTSLDLSANAALKILRCEFNEIKELVLPPNSNLENIGCYNNQIENLDVSKCSKLKELFCQFNGIHQLDLSQNTDLIKCTCYNNQLTSLDFSNNSELSVLYCNSNLLDTLIISQNHNLESLWCDNCQLNNIALPVPSKLQYIFCEANRFSSDPDKMMALIQALPDRRTLSEAGNIRMDPVSNQATLQMFCNFLNWECNIVP